VEENLAGSVGKAEVSPDEQKLIEQAQNGDGQAFGRLIRLHQKRLFRFAYALVKSFDQAEDIVQETFVKAYQAIGTFRPGYAFYPWLSTIARNLTYSQIAREDKKESLENLHEAGYDPESTELGPLEKLLQEEYQSRFYKALMALPDKYRTVFVLRHFEDMDYNQISIYLKIPPGTVDSRLYRARQLLMEQLKDLL
jgi:RNA polymerase sigma-70 factor (ECF subfamily)